MTAIPGTDVPTNPLAASQKAKNPTVTPSLPVTPPIVPMTNVEDIPLPPQQTPGIGAQTSPAVTTIARSTPNDREPWYQTVYAWMLLGTLVGGVLAIIGIYYSAFLYLAPVGPTVGAVAWYTRFILKKYGDKIDPLAS